MYIIEVSLLKKKSILSPLIIAVERTRYIFSPRTYFPNENKLYGE